MSVDNEKNPAGEVAVDPAVAAAAYAATEAVAEESAADENAPVTDNAVDAAADGAAEESSELTGAAAEAKVAALTAKVEKLEAELTERNNSYLRLQADFENFRRRTQKEKSEMSAVVTQNLIKALLPSIDNFERALASVTDDAASLQQGVKMVFAQLEQTLKEHGLAVIAAEGEKFDPNFHQAVMRVENPELADDTVAAELQKGYTVGDVVIRPSMVQVVANS